MAQISETITLYDGTSPVLQRMAQAAMGASSSFDDTAGSARAMSRAAASVDSSAIDKMRDAAVGATGPMSQLKGAFSSTFGQFALGNLAANAVMMVGEKLAALPGQIAAASDQYAGMQARLRLVSGSAQGAAEMNDLIYASALRARGSYNGMLDSVSKIAMTAKDAFPDARQVVPFVEGIQKLFTVGGTGIQQQGDAMLQLTQALGSGRLQGDEFRSIAEAAPLIEQMIAKEMGVAQGELKQLGADGEITADIIKRAILNNTDEINRQFAEMPQTWGGIAQQMGTVGFRAMAPFLEAISDIANSSGVQNIVSWIEGVLPAIGAGLAVITYAIGDVINGITYAADAIVTGIGGAISTLVPILAPLAGAIISVGVAVGIYNAYVAISSALTAVWAARTGIMSVAMKILNAITMANPIMLFVAVVGAAIGAMAAWSIATYGLRGTLVGAFTTIGNVVETVANVVIACINAIIRGINSVAAAWNSSPMRTFFGGSVVTSFSEVSEVQGLGKSWGDRVGGAYDTVANMVKMPSMDYGEGEMFGGLDTGMGTMDDIADATGKTADNTGRMADSIDMLDEELQYLRDVAEQETINKYTSIPVQVSMGGMYNNISNGIDLDGMYDNLRQALEEGMQSAAEGVHV